MLIVFGVLSMVGEGKIKALFSTPLDKKNSVFLKTAVFPNT